ncbi:DUF2599 domain-containing protein [Dietzia alimentaria]|uniref:DUF2599 domain-containing protein n=1 Tax=Dietzia alimentaria TaxID=665550 RepID=UPI00029B00A1|nr:DUF2599 domain-containing protein [Dietzia alimentaria]
MHHRLLTRTRAAAATLVIATMMAGCSDAKSDGSADADAASASASAPSSSSSLTAVPSARATVAPRATPTSPLAPPAPPFIASAAWADSDYGRTLKISPTPAGRRAWDTSDSTVAWQEVLRLHPDADVPGMWEQFDCHWTWARILEPDKPTWNVEPWRPVVTADQMLVEGCNPGGPEV